MGQINAVLVCVRVFLNCHAHCYIHSHISLEIPLKYSKPTLPAGLEFLKVWSSASTEVTCYAGVKINFTILSIAYIHSTPTVVWWCYPSGVLCLKTEKSVLFYTCLFQTVNKNIHEAKVTEKPCA